MGIVTTGANRTWGSTTQAHRSELVRQSVVLQSEQDGAIVADGDYPTKANVVRRQRATSGTATSGIDGTWTEVAGLAGLVAHIRTKGRWRDADTGLRVQLGETERVVVLLDVPAGGNGVADVVLLTDRLWFVDPVRGSSHWLVKEVRPSSRDGKVVCRVEQAREERA